jgi:hypothetical protein
MPPRIEGLFWPPGVEEHVEEHIDAWAIDELIEGGDFFVFRNTAGHPPHRWRVIGRIPGGMFITAVLAEPSDGDPTQWRPVTGWRSEPFEREMYHHERNRAAKKRGKKHG